MAVADGALESGMSNTVPSFIFKLWTLLNDDGCYEYISWNNSGNSFVIKDSQGFCKDVLPRLFKHNNLASFIRQLNMYGFHKKVDLQKSGLCTSQAYECEFYHPDFLRGRLDLLKKIKRKGGEEKRLKREEIGHFLSEVEGIKTQNDNIRTQMEALKMQNRDLWNEVLNLRNKHERQNEVINKLINFLLTIMGGGNPENLLAEKRLMLQQAPTNPGDDTTILTPKIPMTLHPSDPSITTTSSSSNRIAQSSGERDSIPFSPSHVLSFSKHHHDLSSCNPQNFQYGDVSMALSLLPDSSKTSLPPPPPPPPPPQPQPPSSSSATIWTGTEKSHLSPFSPLSSLESVNKSKLSILTAASSHQAAAALPQMALWPTTPKPKAITTTAPPPLTFNQMPDCLMDCSSSVSNVDMLKNTGGGIESTSITTADAALPPTLRYSLLNDPSEFGLNEKDSKIFDQPSDYYNRWNRSGSQMRSELSCIDSELGILQENLKNGKSFDLDVDSILELFGTNSTTSDTNSKATSNDTDTLQQSCSLEDLADLSEYTLFGSPSPPFLARDSNGLLRK